MANVKAETSIRVIALQLIGQVVLEPLTEYERFQIAEQVVQNLNLRGGSDDGTTIMNETMAVARQRGHNVATPSKQTAAPAETPTLAIAPEDDALIDEMFKYHAPEPSQIVAYHAVNEAAKMFARVITLHVPECADRTHAIRVVRDARMWANAAIALKGKV